MIHSTACCDHCASGSGGSCGSHSHGGPPKPRMGWAVSRMPQQRRALGQVSCDQDGNCYNADTGVYTPGPISLAAIQASATQGSCAFGTDAAGNCLPGTLNLTPGSTSSVNSVTSWLTANSTPLIALAAVVGIAATLGGGRRR